MKKLLSFIVLLAIVLLTTANPLATVNAQGPVDEVIPEPTEETAPAVVPSGDVPDVTDEVVTPEPTEEADSTGETEQFVPDVTEDENVTPEPTEELESIDPVSGETDVTDPVSTTEPEATDPVATAEPEATDTVSTDSTVGATGAQAGPWSATIYVSNPNATVATGSIAFYDTAGLNPANYDFASVTTAGTGIPAHGSTALDVASTSVGLTNGFQGSAVVQSSNQVAVQVGLKVSSSIDRMVYSGFTQGAQKVSSPALACNTFDQDSELVVMNTGSAVATVTVDYLSSDAKYTPTTKTVTGISIPANSSKYLKACTELGITSNWLGSATVTGSTASDSLVAVVFQPYVTSPKAVAYETLSGAGANKIFFPTALQKVYGADFTSFYAVQNVGSASTTATMEVFDTSGVSKGTATATLAAGAKVSWQPKDVSGVADADTADFTGSAVVSASAGGEIAGITNIGTKPAGGSCASGAGQTTAFLNPSTANGAATLAIPWVEYKDGTNWRSFIAVQNVAGTGTASGAVSVKYYNPDGTQAGTTHTLATIADGAKGNSNPSANASQTSFLGSVEISSATTTDKLVALSNNQQADGCNGASALAIPIQ